MLRSCKEAGVCVVCRLCERCLLHDVCLYVRSGRRQGRCSEQRVADHQATSGGDGGGEETTRGGDGSGNIHAAAMNDA